MTTDSEFIINDMTPELEAMYALPPIVDNKYRVYFDPISKAILSISNEVNKNFNNYFEASYSEVEKFLSGKESFTRYNVFVTTDSKFKLVPIGLNQADLKASVLVDIPNTDKVEFLTVTNLINDKKWQIEVDPAGRDELASMLVNYRMFIFITSSKNKNFLYRTLSFDLKDLVFKKSIVFDHESEIESAPLKISLSTVQFFKSCGLRNVYESEV